MPFQLQFQSDLRQLPLQFFVFRDQLGNLLAFEVQLAMQHVQILALFAGCRNERRQRGTAQVRTMSDLGASVLMARIEAKLHRHPSLDAVNLAQLPADSQGQFPGLRWSPRPGLTRRHPSRPVVGLNCYASLLVIDNVDGWFGKPGNLLSAAALARVIQRLNELAQSLHVAIVVLARTQLSVEGRITSRQLSRLSQAASVVWMLVKDRGQRIGDRAQGESGRGRDDERRSPRAYRQSARRWFMPVKNNLSPDAATFGRSFELVDGQIRWHGDDPAPSLAEAMLTSAHNTDRRRER
ncbi:MAG TPA: hypothetical protein VGX78_14310, partial [Pirellulales bacterium]|nr:hypothetical protein [Pirellulales bacterium]